MQRLRESVSVLMSLVVACGVLGLQGASASPAAAASSVQAKKARGERVDRGAKGRAGQGRDQSTKKQRLEAWRSKGEAERAELRRRYERMKKLTPEDRARLLGRAERLREEMSKTLAALGAEERSAVMALEPEARRRVLRSLIADRAKVAAARIRSRMTPEERKELDAAKPAERVRLLGRHRRRQLDALPERVRVLGNELGLSPKEIRQLHEGAPAERRAQIARMARRRTERYVKEHGLPEGVAKKHWQGLFDGDDETFLRALRRIRIHNPEFGVSRRRSEGRKRQRQSMARRLESFGAPRPKDRAAHPHTKDHTLRRRAVLNSRERIEELLVRRLQLPLDVAARLRTQSEDEFLRSYRHAIRTLQEGGDLAASLRKRLGSDGPQAKR